MRFSEVRSLLFIFTRYPEPGKTKTRLIPVLGKKGAAELQRRMTEHTMRRIGLLPQFQKANVEIRYEGGSDQLIRKWLGKDYSIRPQGEGDLGDRMMRSFQDGFRGGADRIAIIGTDCPKLGAKQIRRAFEALGKKDLVLGPATDGGFYLIGLRREAGGSAIPALFSGIPWGSGEVLQRSLRIARERDLSYVLLEPLDDVDRPQDLPLWDRVAGDSSSDTLGTISVIITGIAE